MRYCKLNQRYLYRVCVLRGMRQLYETTDSIAIPFAVSLTVLAAISHSEVNRAQNKTKSVAFTSI